MIKVTKSFELNKFNISHLIGGVSAASSLFSLAAKIFNFGLYGVVKEFITFYRELTSFCLTWLPKLFHLSAPQFVYDLWTLSFVGVATTARIASRNRTNETINTSRSLQNDTGLRYFIYFTNYALLTACLGLIFAGLIPVAAFVLSHILFIAMPIAGRAFSLSDYWKLTNGAWDLFITFYVAIFTMIVVFALNYEQHP